MLQYLKNWIESNRSELRSLSDDIWSHPEVAYTETYAVARATEFLRRRGFEVVTPCYGIETAFQSEFRQGDGPTFAFCSEYDALPSIGHGCGHNLICMAGMAAFCATAELLRSGQLSGRVVLFGTPAEEGGGGKVRMEAAGCLKGIDAVAMVHPTAITSPDCGSAANLGLEVIFHGKAAHAASAPEKGVNALDALILLFSGVNAYRQQLPEHARIHGVILDGGVVPNVIPDYTRCRFYLRSGVEEWTPVLEQRFRDIVQGAALMTGTTVEIKPFRPPYRSRKPNGPMNQDYIQSMRELGMTVVIPKHQGRSSSDFGNFSQAIPGIHPLFAVSNTSSPADHSPEFCACAGSDEGFANALNAAIALAHVGCRYLKDADFRNAVRQDFAAQY